MFKNRIDKYLVRADNSIYMDSRYANGFVVYCHQNSSWDGNRVKHC